MRLIPVYTEENALSFSPYGTPSEFRYCYDVLRTHHLRADHFVDLFALSQAQPLKEEGEEEPRIIADVVELRGLLILIQKNGVETLYYRMFDNEECAYLTADANSPSMETDLESEATLHLVLRNHLGEKQSVMLDYEVRINRHTGVTKCRGDGIVKEPSFADIVTVVGYDLDVSFRV